MPATSPVTIINVGYRSTNYWVVSAGRSRLLIDLGYPGLMGTMLANLKRMDVPLGEIRYAVATHYHIDHAGCAENLKLAGVPLLVLETQVEAFPIMKRWTKPEDNYTDITPKGNVTISFPESRARLAEIGLAGEIVPTPGHSDDSVTVVLDDGSVFTGDLPPPGFAQDEASNRLVAESWSRLGELGAKRIYPGHGPIRPFLPNR